MNCSTIRRIIDEVDNPANLPYEATSHLEGCRPCRQLTGERERLRKLLLEPARVSAPANFEAMVARRLAGRIAHRRPFWVATGFYLRASAAGAALACMILVIQMARTKTGTPAPPAKTGEIARTDDPTPGPSLSGAANGNEGAPAGTVLRTGSGAMRRHHGIAYAVSAGDRPGVMVKETLADISAQPRAILLVRNSGSEREIAVPMVSVGAQPWLSISLHSQDERGVRTAF